MRRVVAVLALMLFAACQSFTTDVNSDTMTGNWRGTVSGQTLTLSLQQSGQTLAGTGTLVNTSPATTSNLSVSGSYTKPTLSLTMLSTGSGPTFNLEGLVEGDSFVGNLSGGTFASAAIAMVRVR